ncbi:ABC transporter substrate-binding protein [Vogesella sp. LIG4]|uniref:ABC transporter substrate-binding protein n=1 Tax=Vogesella sp. LIG4 TaxID=1192162 RepID=UPI00081F859C|nr:ABC transporter substrate-binding protein [Vogesella sp. LIG4]SCK16433.1 putative spermidine/putrescine transport system substrate-binding protein [Vogesella sp. LIG4]
MKLQRSPLQLSLAIATLLSTTAMAGDLVVVSYGGANKNAQTQAYYQPYAKAHGVNVIGAEWNGEAAKLKSMVDTRTVSWDVVEIDSQLAGRGCEEGILEPINPAKIDSRADMMPGALLPCAVGMFVSSTALAYSPSRLKGTPTGWKDFWDIKKYPGKRGLRKGALYTLEIALLADGVAQKDVYKVLATPAGTDRAFRKLDQIKPYIQWWESGSQAPQYLLAGDVVMTSAYNGRITNARKEGKDLKLVWDSGIYEMDYWAIPKGNARKDEALRFISFATRPENQKVFSDAIPYGPTNRKTLKQLAPATVAELPTATRNLEGAMPLDANFWIEHGEDLEQRFNAWASR